MSGPIVTVGGGLAVVLLLGLSAFFSSSEIAVFSLQKDWIAQQAATGDRRAQVLQELYDNPHRLLVTLLVGNNIVNIAISSIITVLVASYLSPGPAVVATTVGKFLSGTLSGRFYDLDRRRSLRVGLGLVPRGEFSLVIATLAAGIGTGRLASVLPAFTVGYVLVMSVLGSVLIQQADAITDALGAPSG